MVIVDDHRPGKAEDRLKRIRVKVKAAVYCQLCGKPIKGRGQIFRHPGWSSELSLAACDQCARHNPRCRRCGLPLPTKTDADLCITCLAEMDLCLACKRPILGKTFFFDTSGPYCEDCCQNRSRCQVCDAPQTDASWQLSDGRIICANCHASGVHTTDQATALYEEIKRLVRDQLGFELNIPTGLALVDQTQMREVIIQQSMSDGNLQGAGSEFAEREIEKTLGIYARRGVRRGIYILVGLPRRLFLQIAAHEYAHAWQGENCPIIRDSLVHEGFAEWVAYHVVGRLGYPESQSRMLTREDLYGAGLKWALGVEAVQGVSGVIQACRSAN